MSQTFLTSFFDDDSDQLVEQALSPRQQAQAYIDSVLSDVDRLLNSKMNIEFYESVAFDQLLSFGVVDFSTINIASKESLEHLRQVLIKTLATNEPRLTGVKVAIKESAFSQAQIAFQIDAMLLLSDGAELIMFNAAFVPVVKRFRLSRS
ncbi:type VI secretion system baseplate subunit TssE [Nitrincola tibetensis]|uniref:Type VI secretion system baseplate subunit TssE n=1 Tax=Nitrincola tibetensis TaxID=2219697 RepID=A0A364NPR6_9GAMM|nr:type VI secretion system baseplate subunit TssE [Nitrincola tibetensis]RAU19044.1 type VI secretion system baseplate subunit TssE [Nitrincola tibetensis]